MTKTIPAFKGRTIKDHQETMHKHGYLAQRRELLALIWLFDAPRDSGTKSLLIEGLPGVGKTFFSETVGLAYGIPVKYYLCHSWSDDQELLQGIDVTAAVAGHAEKVAVPGILTQASMASMHGPVIVVLDEVDKTEDRTQNLLLDWLQTGRAQTGPGSYVQGNPDNLYVFITSNATKPISPALMRRLRRLRMEPLPKELQVDIISESTKVSKDKVKHIVETAYKAAETDKREISFQELRNLTQEILNHAECLHDVQESICAWCLRSDKNRSEIRTMADELYKQVFKSE